MSKKLTIGMATYDDFDGVYFSIQAARMYHREVYDDLEFIVVDNNPHGMHGKEVKMFVEHHCRDSHDKPNGRYIPVTDRVSTAIRNETFKESNTPFTLNMDCHVLLYPESLEKLINFYDNNSETNDLFHGPMVYDNLMNGSISTHMNPTWRSQMFGTWETDLDGLYEDNEPFEIPMHGMGLFSCRTDAWAGFNSKFRGFGGEEGYIHKKFQKRGDKVWCLPFLRWMHRFQRPEGPKYPLTMEQRVRNYFIGFLELEEDIEPIIEHFKEWKPENQLRLMLEDVKRELGMQ